MDNTTYNQEFPEQFKGFAFIDSIASADIAEEIICAIDCAIRKGERNELPGLRAALRIIAKREGFTANG